jgi:hypothetical protein
VLSRYALHWEYDADAVMSPHEGSCTRISVLSFRFAVQCWHTHIKFYCLYICYYLELLHAGDVLADKLREPGQQLGLAARLHSPRCQRPGASLEASGLGARQLDLDLVWDGCTRRLVQLLHLDSCSWGLGHEEDEEEEQDDARQASVAHMRANRGEHAMPRSAGNSLCTSRAK